MEEKQNNNDSIKYLKEFILFSEMDQKRLQEIDNLMETKYFSKNHTIFMENETGNKVYFLRRGTVKILKTSRDGKEQILEIFNPGEVFGEVVLFGINNYPATVQTMNEVEVKVLSRQRFKDYFKNHPMIGWGMLKVMARKLYRSQHRIKSLGLRDTRGRVAAFLMEMYQEARAQEGEAINLKINQQEMADYIGTSRETVSRTLSLFKDENLIEIDRSKLSLLDPEGLEEYL